MTYLLDFSFYHIYTFLRKEAKSNDPLGGSVMLLTIIGYLFSFSIVMLLLARLFNTALPSILIIVGSFTYLFLLQRLIKKYFKRKDKVHNIILKFRNRSKAQNRWGYLAVLLLFAASFFAFLLGFKIGF